MGRDGVATACCVEPMPSMTESKGRTRAPGMALIILGLIVLAVGLTMLVLPPVFHASYIMISIFVDLASTIHFMPKSRVAVRNCRKNLDIVKDKIKVVIAKIRYMFIFFIIPAFPFLKVCPAST